LSSLSAWVMFTAVMFLVPIVVGFAARKALRPGFNFALMLATWNALIMASGYIINGYVNWLGLVAYLTSLGGMIILGFQLIIFFLVSKAIARPSRNF